MELRFARSFYQSAEWFITYYEGVFPEGQPNATQALEATLSSLETDRTLERRWQQLEGVYELVIAKTPFSILYRYREDHIRVLYLNDRRGYQAVKALK